MHYGYMTGQWDFWTVLGHIVIVLLVVWLIIRIVAGPRWRRGWRGPGMWGTHSALTTLHERYAKGEISKEEYEERKKTLKAE